MPLHLSFTSPYFPSRGQGSGRNPLSIQRHGCRTSARPALSLAAREAQNQCTLVVFLADARVGAELRKAQEAGDIAGHGGDRSKVRASDLDPPTLSEISIAS